MKKLTKIIAATGIVAGLGVAGLPLFSYATGSSANDSVNVKLKVNDSISIEIAATEIDLGTITPGTTTGTGHSTTATITTNNQTGFKTSVGYTNLTTTTGGAPIEAGNVATGTSAYGISVGATDSGTYTAAQTIGETDSYAYQTPYTIYFGASASADQATGNYQGTVTITATNN